MAIITSFPGIEAIVLVNGAKAREYIDEHIHTRERNDEQVQRFIDSVDDAEFAIRILINNDYKFLGHDALGIKVHVDGEYRCSTVWNKNHPKEYMYMCGSRVQKADGGSSVIAFKFTAIETVEGEGKSYERALVDKQKEGTEQTGEIAVYVSRLKIKEKMMGLVGDGGKTTENQHSKLLFKANSKKKLTHGTGFGAEVESSKSAVRYTCTPIDCPNNPIATFAFMYRAKNVLVDELNVTPISEELALPVRKDSGMFVEQGTNQPPKPIKNEPNATDDNASGDIYGATDLRQIQPPAHAVTPAPADNMAVFQNLLMSLGLTEEQEILAQQLRCGVNSTAQNLQTPRPTSQPTAFIAPDTAQDSVKVKQEREEATGGRRPMNTTIPRHTYYQERQTGNGGIAIDLTTPVQETFIKPDPDATGEVANQVEDTVAVEQTPSNQAADNIFGYSVTTTVTENTVALEFPNLEATRAAVRASIEKNEKARQGSMSTVDGVTSPKTPKGPVQEPAFERAEERDAINSDAMQVEQIEQVEKPATPKTFSSAVEVDVIASIEAADAASSAMETVRHRKDSILSDASMDFIAELQRARSGHPTITTVHSAGQYSSPTLSPTPQPDETNSIVSREATEGIPVETIDIDMTTGRDIHEHSTEDDSHSPSRQLIGNFDSDEGFEIIYSPIKGVENTIIGTPLPAAKVAEKPTGGFEAALTTQIAQAISDNIQTAEDTTSPLTSEKPTLSFEETMARAESKTIKKPTALIERAATPFPALQADVEVPATPIAAPKEVALPASEVHTGDHGFVNLESIVAVPETPVKHSSLHGLTKNAIITTPTTSKETPNIVEKLSAIKGLSLGTPARRFLFPNRKPSSKFGDDTVDTPVTGNAGRSGKKTTPIKRERDDEENEVVQVETPTKKMKYLKLGSNKDEPISFDSDDELPEAEFEPVKVAEMSHFRIAKSGAAEVAVDRAQNAGDAQAKKEKSCSMM